MFFNIAASLVEISLSDLMFYDFKVSRTNCERGWVHFGKKCYKFSSYTATFKDAMIREYLSKQ